MCLNMSLPDLMRWSHERMWRPHLQPCMTQVGIYTSSGHLQGRDLPIARPGVLSLSGEPAVQTLQ